MAEATWTGKTEQAARAYFRRFRSIQELRDVWLPWDALTCSVADFLKVKALGSFTVMRCIRG